MTNEIATTTSPFDTIKQVRHDGTEYWSARDLVSPLGYSGWERFQVAIERAQAAAVNQGFATEDHFRASSKMVVIGSGTERAIKDYELTRYAAYLVAMNGDPRKPEIASAQSYFAIQTRVAETQQPIDPKPLSKNKEAEDDINFLALLAEKFPSHAKWANDQALATSLAK